jgi:dimethylglycine dehydrogenase
LRSARTARADRRFHECGSLRIASSPEQLSYFERVRARSAAHGLSIDLLGPEETHERWPAIDADGVLGSAFIDSDGHVDPSSLTHALAAEARRAGASIEQRCEVIGLSHRGGRWHIATSAGALTAEIVVNAAGMWAPHVAAMAGAPLPVVPLEHQYVVTGPVDVARPDSTELPVLRDTGGSFYVREEGRALLVGPFEAAPVPWSVTGAPQDFGAQLLAPDLDRIETVYEAAVRRVPVLADAGIATVVNGPDSYTPDGLCLLGWAPGVPNMFTLTGFSIFGIVFAGGAGRAAAELVTTGRASWDLAALAPARFAGLAAGSREVIAGAQAAYAREYAVHDATNVGCGQPRRWANLVP